MGALFENKRRYNTIQSLTFLTSSVLNLAIRCVCSIYYMYLIFSLDIIFPFVVVVPAYPASTGILTHSLPDLGFGGFAFALKLPGLLNTHLAAVRAKLGQTSCFPNGPQIWCPIGQ